MTDDRWIDVLWSVDSAIKHFQASADLFDRLHEASNLTPYVLEMALQHAMQAGYTSFETAVIRTMTMLNEERPVGGDWHKQLMDRAAAPIPGKRDAILTREVAHHAREVRKFRHWAMHGYDDAFDPEEARKAVEAASRLRALLRPMFEAFIRTTDP